MTAEGNRHAGPDHGDQGPGGPQRAARTISNSTIGALMAFLRRVHGDDTVHRVLAEADVHRPLAELTDPTFWSTSDEVEALFLAARMVTGDEEVSRHAGEELLTNYASSEVVTLIASLDSLGDAFRLIAEAASKATTALHFACLEVGERHALVCARRNSADGIYNQRSCRYSEGVFSSLPTLFGIPAADVTQVSCIARGDDACVFAIRWDPEAAEDPAVQARFLRRQVDALTRRFEALEEMATDLATVTDVDELLDRIIHRAGVAVRAPRYLVAVNLPGDDHPRVHHVGFSDGDEAQRAATAMLAIGADDDDGDHSHLVVDVAAAGRRFGRLGAFFPPGHRFLPAERRLLAAYAGHAAAALQTAAAMADRQRQADTNAALLGLAAALAEVTTADEVARRLAAALPGVLGCPRCAVFAWEPDDDQLVLMAAPAGPTPSNRPRVHLGPDALGRLTAASHHVLTSGDEPELDAVLRTAGLRGRTGAIPVAAAGTLLAVVGVAWDGAPADGPVAADPPTVAGVVGLAATAFRNARLVQRIEHQAQHDPLTGLANLRLFRELAAVALSNGARRRVTTGLLFVDLDGFKAVNDRLGHATGDAVLAQVAVRLCTAVRTGDTVGRLGGDEFVVLLPEVRDAGEATGVATRILELLERPLESAPGPVVLSASIGAALSWPTATFDELLARADVAMYQAKAAGGGRSSTLVGADPSSPAAGRG